MTTAAIIAGLLGSNPSRAEEGQWLPEQLSELGPERLKAAGLELSAEDLWDGGPKLLRAAVSYSGCSAGFVSDQGLLATNHHCAYPALQAQSRPDRDLLKNGFVAASRDQELRALGGAEVDVLVAIEDVTERIRPAVEAAKSDVDRVRVAERQMNALSVACETEHPEHRCQVHEHGFGARYRLVRTFQIRDVRLAYAPPSGVGEFGGEVDNWSWPRHSGDFALLRAYVAPDGSSAAHSEDNVPYRPDVHFRISPEGVGPGDFVMVAGYPGHTDRHWPAAEVQRHVEDVFPAVIDLYGEWLDLIERHARGRPDLQIQVAAISKGLANRVKNARGMLAGLKRMELVERKRAFDARLPDDLLAEAERLTEATRSTFRRDFLLDSLERGPNLLAVALDAARLAREVERPDVARDPRYADRNRPALTELQSRRVRDASVQVGGPWLASVLGRLVEADLVPSSYGGSPKERLALARRILKRTRLDDPEEVQKLFEAPDRTALEADDDPLLALGRILAAKAERAEADREAVRGGWMRIGPRYLEAVRAARAPDPIYPDANRTLRVSLARVQGYRVRDGLFATPQTTVGGQVAKHTGRAPFDLPKAVRNAAERAPRSPYADPQLKDVPVCFLSDADTTGGNSGSPVLDRRGRLIGLNFDRVWENIAGDFAYNPAWSRNISVDVRYLLWTLTDVTPAPRLLEELLDLEAR
jgi:hypothetical protein